MPSRDVLTRDTRWRMITLLVASVFPAASDFTHRMGLGLPVDLPWLATTTASALIQLAILEGAFRAAVSRRVSGAWCLALLCAMAVLLGVAESFVGWALAGHLGLRPPPPGHDTA